jgi:hypothetical protein
MLALQGMEKARRGLDPGEDFDRAEKAYSEAIRLDKLIRGPGSAEATWASSARAGRFPAGTTPPRSSARPRTTSTAASS